MSEAPLYSIFIIIFIYTVVNVYQNYKALEHQEWLREHYIDGFKEIIRKNQELYFENMSLKNKLKDQNENRT
ncbi:MAG: hypothetical protein IPI17_02135 [Nitrosomonas sp.]|nr:hypothetical protein [Nitrosomonas sp.]